MVVTVTTFAPVNVPPLCVSLPTSAGPLNVQVPPVKVRAGKSAAPLNVAVPLTLTGPTFANPPFRLLGQVVGKAVAEWRGRRRVRTVLLGPVGCSQRWLHELWPWSTVYWPDKRITYLDPQGRATLGAMQDSAVYVIGNNKKPHSEPVVRVLRVREAGA